MSFDTATLGNEGDGANPDQTILAARNPEFYRKLIMRTDGDVQGIMVIGDKTAIQTARKILAGTARPEDFI